MDTKEKLLTYIRQFDTDAVTIGPPDRTRRSLLNRIHNRKERKIAYADLLAQGLIHESGTGNAGDPIIVVLGPAPSKPVELPAPWSHVKMLTLVNFMMRMQDEYEAKGWDAAIDYEAEIRKALESYQPGRPY